MICIDSPTIIRSQQSNDMFSPYSNINFKKRIDEAVQKIISSDISKLDIDKMTQEQLQLLLESIAEKFGLDISGLQCKRNIRRLNHNHNNFLDSNPGNSNKHIQTNLSIPCKQLVMLFFII